MQYTSDPKVKTPYRHRPTNSRREWRSIICIPFVQIKQLTKELTADGTGGIQKSSHPIEPVIHLVGDNKTKYQAMG